MEQNRNMDFDSDVELDSLKDAVWRLTTRVYLLEDFIADRFGEVLGPSGFSKSKSPDPGSSLSQTYTQGTNCNSILGVNANTSNSPHRSKKWGKRRRCTISEVEGGGIKIQKVLDKANADNISVTGTQLPDLEAVGKSETDELLLIPKNENLPQDHIESECNDYFLNGNELFEEEDGEPSDSVEKDPDFIPALDSDDETQNVQNNKGVRKMRQSQKHEGNNEKSKALVQKWKEIVISTEELQEAWRFNRRHEYKSLTTEYYSCWKGGRKCPAQLKSVMVLSDASKTFFINELEHSHSHATKSGLTREQKRIISEILIVNSDITPSGILHILKDKGIQTPTTLKLSNFLKYKRRKSNQKVTCKRLQT